VRSNLEAGYAYCCRAAQDSCWRSALVLHLRKRNGEIFRAQAMVLSTTFTAVPRGTCNNTQMIIQRNIERTESMLYKLYFTTIPWMRQRRHRQSFLTGGARLGSCHFRFALALLRSFGSVAGFKFDRDTVGVTCTISGLEVLAKV
jgi:hypothetical protein